MSQKYSEEYYALKAELAELQEQLSAFENAGGRAQKFLKLTERYAAFTDLTPAILNEFISRIEVHERDKKRAKQAIQHIGIYFNYPNRPSQQSRRRTERLPGLRLHRLPRRSKERPADRAREAGTECAGNRP